MASDFAIRHATHQIRRGGVIAYPTDTVYGLGCDPMDVEAVNRLCQLKQRDISKGLILLGNKIELFSSYIKPLSGAQIKIICQTKAPTSWIVPASNSAPAWLTGNRDTLVIRITQHSLVSILCNQLGHPLVSSSANPGGHKPAINVFQVHQYFHHKVDAILVSTQTSSGQPSTIRQLATGEVLR